MYDILTAETLPPRGENGGLAAGGTGRLPGASRRASIFDRIADVVYNEEHKDQEPVDTVAVR